LASAETLQRETARSGGSSIHGRGSPPAAGMRKIARARGSAPSLPIGSA